MRRTACPILCRLPPPCLGPHHVPAAGVGKGVGRRCVGRGDAWRGDVEEGRLGEGMSRIEQNSVVQCSTLQYSRVQYSIKTLHYITLQHYTAQWSCAPVEGLMVQHPGLLRSIHHDASKVAAHGQDDCPQDATRLRNCRRGGYCPFHSPSAAVSSSRGSAACRVCLRDPLQHPTCLVLGSLLHRRCL